MAWNRHANQDRYPALTELLFALVPASCLLCRQAVDPVAAFCPGCDNDLPRNQLCCASCAAGISSGSLCGDCLGDPPPFDSAYAPLRYEFPVSGLIGRLKYGDSPATGTRLGNWLGRELMETRPALLPDAIVPVPLHVSRLRERGYNQSLILAHAVGRRLGCPVRADLVHRTLATPSQVGRSRKQRKIALGNAFAPGMRPAPDSCVIVDDVITTGATIRGVANVLRQSGAQSIEAWSLARA